MKRLLALILVWLLLVITGTIVSADGQTRRNRSGGAGAGAINLDKIDSNNGGK